MTSLGAGVPADPDLGIQSWRRPSRPFSSVESTMTRIGCSREASFAASIASSSSPSLVAMTSGEDPSERDRAALLADADQ